MSVHQHKQENNPVKCMVLTISDTRTEETDKSGNLMKELLEEAEHSVTIKKVIHDEKDVIQNAVAAGCENANVDVILTNGGTGIAYRDVTIETIQPMLSKEMSGFGEIFRVLSYQEDIGSAAILSRAIAGVIGHTAIFATPGSSGAVKLAMNKLIIPEITHVVQEVKKDIR
ncbi:molybdenum cofactor biosynthesis protein B [Lentibacillus sp. CBA3610]|uniref:MogA/MoaB family molybdenum cofactor biosynthesis protein n=1 Tax=Lentibacillus sp. CBA3610 TaxID=2518176 RepID=UPI0015959AED|nr:MogA/MoaB family molybdenum cofactor biosynthesis protein [Lentibacillus sp. CBA3610]QKY69682.1 MogA/MoaB family molybdenum cofactor biosynthesis protein [Lentibacillus sp. CBA3610]